MTACAFSFCGVRIIIAKRWSKYNQKDSLRSLSFVKPNQIVMDDLLRYFPAICHSPNKNLSLLTAKDHRSYFQHRANVPQESHAHHPSNHSTLHDLIVAHQQWGDRGKPKAHAHHSRPSGSLDELQGR